MRGVCHVRQKFTDDGNRSAGTATWAARRGSSSARQAWRRTRAETGTGHGNDQRRSVVVELWGPVRACVRPLCRAPTARAQLAQGWGCMATGTGLLFTSYPQCPCPSLLLGTIDRPVDDMQLRKHARTYTTVSVILSYSTIRRMCAAVCLPAPPGFCGAIGPCIYTYKEMFCSRPTCIMRPTSLFAR